MTNKNNARKFGNPVLSDNFAEPKKPEPASEVEVEQEEVKEDVVEDKTGLASISSVREILEEEKRRKEEEVRFEDAFVSHTVSMRRDYIDYMKIIAKHEGRTFKKAHFIDKCLAVGLAEYKDVIEAELNRREEKKKNKQK